jgi:hypothetical protein
MRETLVRLARTIAMERARVDPGTSAFAWVGGPTVIALERSVPLGGHGLTKRMSMGRAITTPSALGEESAITTWGHVLANLDLQETLATRRNVPWVALGMGNASTWLKLPKKMDFPTTIGKRSNRFCAGVILDILVEIAPRSYVQRGTIPKRRGKITLRTSSM